MEYTEEEWELAFDNFRNGVVTEESIKILVTEGLKEYEGEYSSVATEVVEKAHNREDLTGKDFKVIEDIYGYLEDVNFHTELQAIEIYTNVDYV